MPIYARLSGIAFARNHLSLRRLDREESNLPSCARGIRKCCGLQPGSTETADDGSSLHVPLRGGRLRSLGHRREVQEIDQGG